MLDVHAPEHRIGGVRDFLIHLLTITVGLLIALGLENTAESLHHAHLRNEAVANITAEIRSNQHLLKTGAPKVMEEQQALLKMLAALQGVIAAKPDAMHDAVTLGFQETPIPDAAWQTAGSTGVLSYMSYDQVARFSAAYQEQALLQATEEKALEDYLELMPTLKLNGKNISPAQAAQVLPVVQKALAHVSGMLAIGQGTLGTYDEALR